MSAFKESILGTVELEVKAYVARMRAFGVSRDDIQIGTWIDGFLSGLRSSAFILTPDEIERRMREAFEE